MSVLTKPCVDDDLTNFTNLSWTFFGMEVEIFWFESFLISKHYVFLCPFFSQSEGEAEANCFLNEIHDTHIHLKWFSLDSNINVMEFIKFSPSIPIKRFKQWASPHSPRLVSSHLIPSHPLASHSTMLLSSSSPPPPLQKPHIIAHPPGKVSGYRAWRWEFCYVKIWNGMGDWGRDVGRRGEFYAGDQQDGGSSPGNEDRQRTNSEKFWEESSETKPLGREKSSGRLKAAAKLKGRAVPSPSLPGPVSYNHTHCGKDPSEVVEYVRKLKRAGKKTPTETQLQIQLFHQKKKKKILE